MTLLFSFCKVRHEWEDSLKAVAIPGFQALPPGGGRCAEEKQPSKLLTLNLKRKKKSVGRPGCVFCLWKIAEPSVLMGCLSGEPCFLHREVLVAQDTSSLRGGQVAVPTLWGKGS